MTNKTLKSAAELLLRSEKILIVGPTHWSVDQTASMLALYQVLNKNGKSVTALAPDPISEKIQFLPYTDVVQDSLGNTNDLVISIKTDDGQIADLSHVMHDGMIDIIISPSQGKISPEHVSFKKFRGNFDVIVTLGVSNLEATGPIFESYPQLFDQTPIINLSSDPENDFYGRVNIVDPQYSSLCEIIFHLIAEKTELQSQLKKNLATILLTGIIAETESFLAPTTNSSAFRAASVLQSLGAMQSDIVEHLFKQKSFNNLKVLGQILNNLEISDSHRFGWATLRQTDFDMTETSTDDIDHWTDQILRHAEGTEIFALIVEQKNKIIVQLRSALTGLDLSSFVAEISAENSVQKYGFDLTFTNKNISDVQAKLRTELEKFQSSRLRIDPETSMHLLEITLPEENTLDTDTETESQAKPIKKALAPASVPFELATE